MAIDVGALKPTGQRIESVMGYGGGEPQYDTWYTSPEGVQVFQRPDGQYYTVNNGQMYTFDPAGNQTGQIATGGGSFWDNTLGKYGLGDIGTTVANDPKFLAFLGTAAGGAYASSLAGGGAAATGAGGATASGAGSAPLGSGLSVGGAPSAAGMGGGTGLVAGGAPAAAGMGGGTGLTTAAAGGGTLGAGGVTAGLGAATGVGSTGMGGGGSGAGNAAGNAAGSSMLDSALSYAKNNPGLVGAGLGALAGAASGSVDVTQTGKRGLVDYALPAGQDYARMAQDTIGGKYLGQGLGTNPYSGANPYLGQSMDNVSRRMTDAYKNGTAAQTMGQFAQAGAFGGSAHQQFAESQNRAFADSLGQTLGNMQMQDYTTQQGLAENQLNRNLQQFQGERANMMGASTGLGNLGQTSTSTMQGVGPVQGALAGAMGGWAMGNSWGQSAPQQVGTMGNQGLATNVQQNPNAVKYSGIQPNFYGAY